MLTAGASAPPTGGSDPAGALFPETPGAAPSRGLSTAERDRVERDPLVQRVVAAVQGKVTAVLPPRRAENKEIGATSEEK